MNLNLRSRRGNEADKSKSKPASPRRRLALPFVFSNFAITADGKIAFADRSFVPFAGKRDQQHMMELRATADAVMSGARTVDLSPATLGSGGEKYRQQRLKRGLQEYNLRIIVSGSGSIDPNAQIFKYRPLTRPSDSDTLSPSAGERAGVRGKRRPNQAASPIIILTTNANAPRPKPVNASNNWEPS